MHRAQAFIDASRQEENPSSLRAPHLTEAGISRPGKRKSLRQKGTVVTGFRLKLSTEKFYPTVAKMQKNLMTTHNV
jgi:hypothetical protein